MTALRLATAFVVALLGVSACARPTADTIRAFDEAALQANGRPVEEIARWAVPIRLSIAPAFPADVQQRAASIVVDLAAGAGLGVRPTTASLANYVIEVGHRCETQIAWTDAGVIVTAVVRVPPHRARDPRCWHHETLHALGLRGHVSSLHSVLSYGAGAAQEATPLDRLLLRTLYRPEMPPKAADARRIARAMLADSPPLACSGRC